MGEDPFLASSMAVPYIRAVQANDVAACVKHYALNNQEWNRTRVNVEVDERTLREIYLPAYRAAVVDGGVLTVMNGYNKFRGEYCSHSDYLNNQILKKEWGFKGFVVTDWGGVHDTIKGALGGLDVEMNSGRNIRYFKKPLLDAVRAGTVPMSVIDDKALRVLYVMAKTSLLDGEERVNGSRNTPAHAAVARQVAESAIVLLKNEENLLPMDGHPAGWPEEAAGQGRQDRSHALAQIHCNACRQPHSGSLHKNR
jgi:beta-glucosidase